MDIHDVAINL